MRKNRHAVRRRWSSLPLGIALVALSCAKPAPPIAPSNEAGAGAASSNDVSAAASEPACPALVPEALNPPADATLALALAATGVQIYQCSVAAGQAPAWTLEAPHAVLVAAHDPVAIHFAGPTWQALDGSRVAGAKLAAAPSPDPAAIPWLLIAATPAAPQGKLGDITHIQRLDTVAGLAPSSGCDANSVGARVLVPYRADYFFYHKAPPGEPVRQCRSQAQ